MDNTAVWIHGVDEAMDPNFAAYPIYPENFGFDTGSQYDNSSYAHSSAPASEVDFAQNRGTMPHYYTQPSKPMRMDTSTTNGHPVQYPESGYFSSSTMSPSLEELYPTAYPQQSQDYIPQDYFKYEYSTNHVMFAEFNERHSMTQAGPDSPQASSDEETTGSSSESSTPPRSHPLYNAVVQDDGLYHCPFASSEDCGHEPKQLKCEYDKYIDSHLKPFRCRHDKCSDLQFSSTACLLRHEREAHEMHGHEESLCEYPPCNRSLPGNGFRRSYNCKDHMSRCHGWVDHNPQEGKKRKTTGAGITKSTKTKTAAKVSSKKQQIAHLREEFLNGKARLEDLTRNLSPDGPLFAIALTQINAETQTLKSIQTEWSKLTGHKIIR